MILCMKISHEKINELWNVHNEQPDQCGQWQVDRYCHFMTAFLRSFVAHQRHCKNSSLDVASYAKPWFGILEIRSHIATNRTRAPKL